MQRTFVCLKPDCVQNNHIGDCLKIFENSGLKLVAMKMIKCPRELAAAHYAVHKERPFFASLVDSFADSIVVPCCFEGENAIARVREICGATNPANAAPGTIRALYASSIDKNTVHSSDGEETATFELGLWFNDEDFTH
eukprot:TRINITY_DN1827_c0_g1_i1.p1 TRINITY_DN1827_c0_g1~~TRINITY_DN1827_c0_g1_i1.p1  ORF type:complete len:148 (+),score=59.14 TRINITY_DN1827_c0_g1_i1:28-444(+)